MNNNDESKSNKQIVSGSIISYIIIGINVLLGLVYTPWILREIGTSQYGLYTLASSLISLFLMDFGMSAAVTRFIALYRAKNDEDGINQVYTIVLKFYLIAMAIISIILLIIYFNIGTIYCNLEPEELAQFKIIYIITAFCVVVCFPVNVFNGVLNSFEKYIALKLSDVVNRIGTVVVTIVALLLGGNVYCLILISGIFNIVTLIVKVIVVKRKSSIRFLSNYSNIKKLKEIAVFSGWTTVSSLSQQMIFNIMPTVLAMTLDTFAITLYGFANTIEGYVSMITGAINGLFLPKISRVLKDDLEEGHSNILPLMVKVGRINQAIVSLLFIGFLVLGKQFVNLWLGEEYGLLYYCNLLLLVPYLISSSFQIANSSIIVINKIKYMAIINLCTGIFNLIAAYFIAPLFGVIGVCSVICITYLARALLYMIVYVKLLNIDLKKFFIECHLKMSPGILLSCVISFLLVYSLQALIPNINGWLGFLFSGVFVVLIFLVCMHFLGWNKEEKHLFEGIIKRKKKEVSSNENN